MKYEVIPVICDYIESGEGYDKLIKSVSLLVDDDDILVISETPVSTAEGNLVDESEYDYGITSYIITDLWSKLLWGYILGPLLKINRRTVNNLRIMPPEARQHKEFILKKYGLKHALQPTAEAGVDLSNVPGSFVSLLPDNPAESAENIKKLVKTCCDKSVEVIIIDTDYTYEFNNTLFTTLPQSVDEIKNNTGIFGYLLRTFTRKVGCTPLASTINLDVKRIIEIGNIAEECQLDYSDDFFETVYNMGDKFNVDTCEVNVDMLKNVTHVPAVIIRNKYL